MKNPDKENKNDKKSDKKSNDDKKKRANPFAKALAKAKK